MISSLRKRVSMALCLEYLLSTSGLPAPELHSTTVAFPSFQNQALSGALQQVLTPLLVNRPLRRNESRVAGLTPKTAKDLGINDVIQTLQGATAKKFSEHQFEEWASRLLAQSPRIAQTEMYFFEDLFASAKTLLKQLLEEDLDISVDNLGRLFGDEIQKSLSLWEADHPQMLIESGDWLDNKTDQNPTERAILISQHTQLMSRFLEAVVHALIQKSSPDKALAHGKAAVRQHHQLLLEEFFNDLVSFLRPPHFFQPATSARIKRSAPGWGNSSSDVYVSGNDRPAPFRLDPSEVKRLTHGLRPMAELMGPEEIEKPAQPPKQPTEEDLARKIRNRLLKVFNDPANAGVEMSCPSLFKRVYVRRNELPLAVAIVLDVVKDQPDRFFLDRLTPSLENTRILYLPPDFKDDYSAEKELLAYLDPREYARLLHRAAIKTRSSSDSELSSSCAGVWAEADVLFKKIQSRVSVAFLPSQNQLLGGHFARSRAEKILTWLQYNGYPVLNTPEGWLVPNRGYLENRPFLRNFGPGLRQRLALQRGHDSLAAMALRARVAAQVMRIRFPPDLDTLLLSWEYRYEQMSDLSLDERVLVSQKVSEIDRFLGMDPILSRKGYSFLRKTVDPKTLRQKIQEVVENIPLTDQSSWTALYLKDQLTHRPRFPQFTDDFVHFLNVASRAQLASFSPEAQALIGLRPFHTLSQMLEKMIDAPTFMAGADSEVSTAFRTLTTIIEAFSGPVTWEGLNDPLWEPLSLLVTEYESLELWTFLKTLDRYTTWKIASFALFKKEIAWPGEADFTSLEDWWNHWGISPAQRGRIERVLWDLAQAFEHAPLNPTIGTMEGLKPEVLKTLSNGRFHLFAEIAVQHYLKIATEFGPEATRFVPGWTAITYTTYTPAEETLEQALKELVEEGLVKKVHHESGTYWFSVEARAKALEKRQRKFDEQMTKALLRDQIPPTPLGLYRYLADPRLTRKELEAA